MKKLASILLGIVSFAQGSVLIKRNLVSGLVCPGESVFAAGSKTWVNSLSLNVENDSYLQSFVAPLDSTLCSLSFSMDKPSTDVSVRLDVYDNTTPQINIVNGIASPVAFASIVASGDKLIFPFCSKEQSLTLGSVYSMAISLKANSAPLKLKFGDSGAQGLFFGPSFGAEGTVQNIGLTFNLTAGTSKPSCLSSTTPSSTTPSKTTTSTSKTTTTSTSKTTTTSTSKTTTTSGTKPTSSPVVYCKCRGIVEYEGHLLKREFDDDFDDDLNDFDNDDDTKDLGLVRRFTVGHRLKKGLRHNSILVKRSSARYKIKFENKCGKFVCKCERMKVSVDYISSKDLNFDHFGIC